MGDRDGANAIIATAPLRLNSALSVADVAWDEQILLFHRKNPFEKPPDDAGKPSL